MNNYEIVLVFTPVLTDEELKKAIGDYQKLLKTLGVETVHEDYWGLKQLAYPIQKKTTGFYQVTEFKAASDVIAKLELQCKRDGRVLRFMTIRLDKYAVEYNEKKRLGLIGRKNRKKSEDEVTTETATAKSKGPRKPRPKAKAPATQAPAVEKTPVAEAPAVETPAADTPPTEG